MILTRTADENSGWAARRITKFLDDDEDPLELVDLSWLDDKVTLDVGLYGTLDNAALGDTF